MLRANPRSYGNPNTLCSLNYAQSVSHSVSNGHSHVLGWFPLGPAKKLQELNRIVIV